MILDVGNVIKLPYKGERLSMYIVAPTEDTTTDDVFTAIASMDQDNFDHLLESNSQTYLEMPKFKIESDYELKPILNNLGLDYVFDAYSSDLTGFNADTGKSLVIDDIVQKAFIEVNEEGTEAAAATGIIAKSINIAPKRFVLNRPFLFFIRDNQTKVILFSGRVMHPKP